MSLAVRTKKGEVRTNLAAWTCVTLFILLAVRICDTRYALVQEYGFMEPWRSVRGIKFHTAGRMVNGKFSSMAAQKIVKLYELASGPARVGKTIHESSSAHGKDELRNYSIATLHGFMTPCWRVSDTKITFCWLTSTIPQWSQ